MRIITDIFAWAGREMPEWNTISISGYHIREAGSTAVQELAFTFANAIAYIEAAIASRPGGGFLRAAPLLLLQLRTTIFWRRSPSSAPRAASMPT